VADIHVIELVRDVLDNQLVARRSAQVGKVDDILLRVSSDGTTEVISLECGGVAPARRLEWPLQQVCQWMAARWGLRSGAPYSIAWHLVRGIGPEVQVDVDPDETPGREWDRRVRAHVIAKIPGA
jgi:hypothetical protein